METTILDLSEDKEGGTSHQEFRRKLNAIGYGVFIPIFFVTTGLRFDIGDLIAHPSSLLLIPVLFGALLLVHLIPAIAFVPIVGQRSALTAGLLQSTSLTFIVTAVQIGTELNLMSSSVGAALIAVSLLSVLIFPLVTLALLSTGDMSARGVLIETGRTDKESVLSD